MPNRRPHCQITLDPKTNPKAKSKTVLVVSQMPDLPKGEIKKVLLGLLLPTLDPDKCLVDYYENGVHSSGPKFRDALVGKIARIVGKPLLRFSITVCGHPFLESVFLTDEENLPQKGCKWHPTLNEILRAQELMWTLRKDHIPEALEGGMTVSIGEFDSSNRKRPFELVV